MLVSFKEYKEGFGKKKRSMRSFSFSKNPRIGFAKSMLSLAEHRYEHTKENIIAIFYALVFERLVSFLCEEGINSGAYKNQEETQKYSIFVSLQKRWKKKRKENTYLFLYLLFDVVISIPSFLLG